MSKINSTDIKSAVSMEYSPKLRDLIVCHPNQLSELWDAARQEGREEVLREAEKIENYVGHTLGCLIKLSVGACDCGRDVAFSDWQSYKAWVAGK